MPPQTQSNILWSQKAIWCQVEKFYAIICIGLTFFCLPLKTRANAPWPSRSLWLYSNSLILCIFSHFLT